MIVKIGCCGFPKSRKKYYEVFNVVEVQRTFYKIPLDTTLATWRKSAPPEFEFTVKAWQAITHPPTSPTWRKARLNISRDQYDKYGFLRPTRENFDAWNKTVKAAIILKSKIIVVQTPSSFKCREENIENMRRFFQAIDRRGLLVAWEPRGDWLNNSKLLKSILEELDLIHVVDLLKRKPLSTWPICYIRLHGLNGEINYKYKYSDRDLERLKEEVLLLEANGCSEVYVMFNNVYMWDDALRFKHIIAGEGVDVL